MDGNTAASYVSYALTDVAAIYPITPSSDMAEKVDEWSAYGKKNIFDQEVLVTELQSEAGAAGAVHGSLAAGALTTTYTASQGLLLMVPNMYKIAGELLPGVFHVSARALSAHALSIFGDHQDVMAARQTGFAFLASGSVQEVMDLGGIAHLASIKSRIPFVHFFDGFRTSHEVQKVETLDYKVLQDLLDEEALKEFRNRALNPETPVLRGSAQNPDIYFQARESVNPFYDQVPDIVADYMKEISAVTGRDYKPFNYYGADNPDRVIVAMGSVTEALEETVDYLNARGERVGIIKVRLYRPFSEKYFFDVLPDSVEKIAVLDRTKEPGALGEPLYEDVRTLFHDKSGAPLVVGGRYGLGSKDTNPSHLKTVFDNLKQDQPRDGFTVGIEDDVTQTSLPVKENINTSDDSITRCKFWGFGSDGTVGANKEAIKIIGDKTDMYAQGYFSYDSKKSGGVTVSHLRFGENPIRSTYLIDEADYVACHKETYVHQFDILEGLKPGGTFLLNCTLSVDELEEKLPASMKKYLAENDIDFYIINAVDIAEQIGLGGRINMVMQSAFFKLAEVIPYEDAVKYMKDAIQDAYGKKGEKIVKMNWEAVDKAAEALTKVEVPEHWKQAQEPGEAAADWDAPEFVKNVADPMNKHKGNELPVSAFKDREDGTLPQGTSAYEKRAIAVKVPEWQIEHCIQCNQCSMVCPHAAIRPFLLDEEELANAPEDFETKDAMGKPLKGLKYRIQVSPLDCAGCGNCADVCPAKEDALVMKNMEEQAELQKHNWEYAVNEVTIKDNYMNTTNLKGSQFAQPLLEFSGACAGCGETPYAKLVTQLFGDRMLIANATGCSSIWGGSAPSTPFCTDKNGRGPAWASSLFEDNAEYAYGMLLADKKIREKLEMLIREAVEKDISEELKQAFNKWLENKDDGSGSREVADEIMPLLEKEDDPVVQEIANRQHYLVKRSHWAFGGDGWAYDIGYGGLDHVLSTGEDINVLVFDTEVYSNTGGQSSKATPMSAIAKFAASGKDTKKKDLGLMQSVYGHIYIAQIAMGASMNQTMKAIAEAEAYPGPSLIIAYSPCVAHGIKAGMGEAMDEMKRAVESGYWHLWRYNPELAEEDKNPFVLDSKEPTESFRDFLMGEARYATLMKEFPELAEKLFDKLEQDAKEKRETYEKMAEQKLF